MTWNATRPTRRNREEWTAYEHDRHADGLDFDFDAASCMTGPGLWPDYVDDVESLTLLSGLESTASESDTA